MDVIHHFLRIAEQRILEIHGIPQIIVPPVLPILDDTVYRHVQLPVFFQHPHYLILTLIPLLALHVSVCPQRYHRHVARQTAHLCHHAIGISSIHEVIIYAVADLRTESCLLVRVDEIGGRIVIPIYTIPLYRLYKRNEIFHIPLHHTLGLAALRHLAVLQNTQSVQRFVLIEPERLFHRESIVSRIVKLLERRLSLLGEQTAAVRSIKGHDACLGIENHFHGRGSQTHITSVLFYRQPDFLWLFNNRKALFLENLSLRRLQHPYRGSVVELQFHIGRTDNGFNPAIRKLICLRIHSRTAKHHRKKKQLSTNSHRLTVFIVILQK